MMDTMPKLLPWLARKAGISIEQAQMLWRDAFADGRVRAQCANNPDLFYRSVIEHFQRFSAARIRAQNPQGAVTGAMHPQFAVA